MHVHVVEDSSTILSVSLNIVVLNCAKEYTVQAPNNGHIGDRSLVLCKEVVPISEVGIEQTRSQTTLCLASLVPRLPRGVPASIACGPNHAIERLR